MAQELAAAGVRRGAPLAVAVVPGRGVGLAWAGGTRAVVGDPRQVAEQLAVLGPRWTWWSAREAARPLVAAGFRPRACWDLGAVGMLLHGLRRSGPEAVWAAAHGRELPPEPGPRSHAPSLFDLPDAEDADGPVRADGQLASSWVRGGWAGDIDDAARWAELAARLQRQQEALLRGLPDPRPAAAPGSPGLALLTAYAESAAALLAVELEHDGLPLDEEAMTGLLAQMIGPRPADAAAEAAMRAARDERVLRRFPGPPVDLRNPAVVRELLTRVGIDVPDTRSWRLERYAATSAPVAELLAWRKTERVATTYGWSWIDRNVGPDWRLRGEWGWADGGAGRMTASAGLHNLPAELRPGVRAEPGRVLVRADLGQVEPRVLAAVSGDAGLARAAREDDMYAPVAAALRCDRPTAKVAVLAAMYGQTSGAAGAALRDMERAYPRALGFLRAAEEEGRAGRDVRTYGGRLVRLGPHPPGVEPGRVSGYGRYARNAVVQGAAAELFKAWAASVRAGLARMDGEPRIVLCLHDELLLHVPEAGADDAVALVRSMLEATAGWWAAGSGVRFVADVSVGHSWAEAH
nr:DNA polymerase [Motilibacter aurantiacus]